MAHGGLRGQKSTLRCIRLMILPEGSCHSVDKKGDLWNRDYFYISTRSQRNSLEQKAKLADDWILSFRIVLKPKIVPNVIAADLVQKKKKKSVRIHPDHLEMRCFRRVAARALCR